MSVCQECGTTVADRAQYCMQCGTPVNAGPPPETGSGESPDAVRPAVIAGAVLGVLSAIPIVNLGNCICCMWALGGGGFGAWLMGREHPRGPGGLAYGDGAFVGALSGLFGGIMATMASVPFRFMTSGPESRDQMEQVLLDIIPDIDPATLDAFLEMADFSLISVITMLVINSLLFSLFAMIGGILLVAVIGRQGPPRPVAGPGGLPAGPDSRGPGLDGPDAGPGGTAPPPTI